MKKIITLIFSLSFLVPFSILKADYWLQRADVGGLPRADGTGFSIGTKGYLGTGGTSAGYSKDWWEYDPLTDAWTQKADYGGNAMAEACSFAIGNFGYALSSPLGTDFWKYDPALNIWTQMVNFAGAARQAAVTFVINGKGYVTTGADPTMSSSFNDLWEYDPLLNSWIQKANLPGMARHYASGFSVGNKGYVGTGQSGASIGLTDFWEWDQPSDTWSQKANFPGAGRREASGFAIGNSGYIGMGSGVGAFFYDFYKYDPVQNTWTQKADFGGGQREETSQFVIGNLGYVGTGYNGITPGVAEKDFWEYHPEDSTTAISETSPDNYREKFSIFPNPASQYVVVNIQSAINKNVQLIITDLQGKKVYCSELQISYSGSQTKIDVSNFSKGIYFVELTDACLPDRQEKEKSVKKLLKE